MAEKNTIFCRRLRTRLDSLVAPNLNSLYEKKKNENRFDGVPGLRQDIGGRKISGTAGVFIYRHGPGNREKAGQEHQADGGGTGVGFFPGR